MQEINLTIQQNNFDLEIAKKYHEIKKERVQFEFECEKKRFDFNLELEKKRFDFNLELEKKRFDFESERYNLENEILKN